MDPEAAAVITPHLLAREEAALVRTPARYEPLLRWRAVRDHSRRNRRAGAACVAARCEPRRAGRRQFDSARSARRVLIAEAIVFHTYLSNTFYGVTNQRVIIVSGLREPEDGRRSARPAEYSATPCSAHPSHIELRAPGDQSYQPSYLPFTNPSVPPVGSGPECYRLVALEDPRRVCELIMESAHKLE